MEEIEDYYTYYVMIMEIPEETFWKTDLPFLDRVAENKTAYDGWLGYAIGKEREKHGK